jgi:hypothetical protein
MRGLFKNLHSIREETRTDGGQLLRREHHGAQHNRPFEKKLRGIQIFFTFNRSRLTVTIPTAHPVQSEEKLALKKTASN